MTSRQREPEFPSRPPMGSDGAVTPSDVSMSDLLASCAAASAVSTPPAPAPSAEAEQAGGPEQGRGPDQDTEARANRRPRHRAARPVPAS
ncbi:hypothetical protein [Streptomyces sp. 8L]|uniref:hypothetical protein n=1 Tax=Streptomyces sp. 8L TaxID=2877242 RepID=UPI001CD38F37|nr:hypothetical protein [Streptomyces sp. 8L]MCA1220121.1 hypothetical protein [Streptomyces sp. 8L]